jgi:hypothetical protein
VTTAARRVAAVPVRSSVDTWHAICDLLAPPASVARAELDAITPVAAVLIAEECTAAAPLVVTANGGPRVRVYTVHGDDAAEAQHDELPLATWPCDRDNWAVSLPCTAADLPEMTAALANRARFSVRDMNDGIEVGHTAESAGAASAVRPVIDLAELERP